MVDADVQLLRAKREQTPPRARSGSGLSSSSRPRSSPKKRRASGSHPGRAASLGVVEAVEHSREG